MKNRERKSLEKFLLDIDSLGNLKKYVDGFNYFDILKIARTEIRHSNVLAWLMNPSGEHGLEEKFIRNFIKHLVRAGYIDGKESLKWLAADCSNFNIFREYHNIDVLAVNDKEKLVICIENKIDSKDRKNQLNKYSKIINEKYGKYNKTFVYLTTDYSGPTNETDEDWALFGYSDIYNILENQKTNIEKNISDKARIIIEDYMDILRREFVNNKEIEKICDSIYKEHKEALDLIFSNKPDKVKYLVDNIVKWCEEKQKAGEIIFCPKDSIKSYTRFRTKDLDRVIGDAQSLSDWKTYNHYFYEINAYQKDNCIKYRLLLSLNSRDLSSKERKKLESVATAAGKNSIKKNWRWITVQSYSSKIIKEDEELPSEDEVKQELDKFWEKMKDIEKKIINNVTP